MAEATTAQDLNPSTADGPAAIASTAARLRAATEAYYRFVGLAALDCLLAEDKLAALARDVAAAGQDACDDLAGSPLTDSPHRRRSALYGGRNLDD